MKQINDSSPVCGRIPVGEIEQLEGQWKEYPNLRELFFVEVSPGRFDFTPKYFEHYKVLDEEHHHDCWEYIRHEVYDGCFMPLQDSFTAWAETIFDCVGIIRQDTDMTKIADGLAEKLASIFSAHGQSVVDDVVAAFSSEWNLCIANDLRILSKEGFDAGREIVEEASGEQGTSWEGRLIPKRILVDYSHFDDNMKDIHDLEMDFWDAEDFLSAEEYTALQKKFDSVVKSKYPDLTVSAIKKYLGDKWIANIYNAWNEYISDQQDELIADVQLLVDRFYPEAADKVTMGEKNIDSFVHAVLVTARLHREEYKILDAFDSRIYLAVGSTVWNYSIYLGDVIETGEHFDGAFFYSLFKRVNKKDEVVLDDYCYFIMRDNSSQKNLTETVE